MFSRDSKIFYCSTIILTYLFNCSTFSTTALQNFVTNEEFVRSYVDPDLRHFANYTNEHCKKVGVNFNQENVISKFYTCLQPHFLNFTLDEINTVNQSLQEFGTNMKDEIENFEFSDGFLQHFKTNVLSHFCDHVPIILDCFSKEFANWIDDCWELRDQILFGYFNQILPSVCESGGIKLEGLLTIEGQKCVENYKAHIDMCIGAVNSNWQDKRSMQDFCDFIPCLQQIGQTFPCEDKTSEIILQYLFEDAQLSRGCVVNSYIHTEIELTCKKSGIYLEQQNFKDLVNCFDPFLSVYHYLSTVSNSTVQSTKYGRYVYKNLYHDFEMESSAICEIFESNACNASREFIEDCYSNATTQAASPYHGFLTYFEYLIRLECENNNATEIKEILENDKLECLYAVVEGLVSCKEILESLNSTEINRLIVEPGNCGILKFLQNCSSTTLLQSCKNPESFAIMQNLLNQIEYRINDAECSDLLLTVQERKSPMINGQGQPKHYRLQPQAVLMFVLLGILGVVFIFVVVSISCKKSNRLIPVPVRNLGEELN